MLLEHKVNCVRCHSVIPAGSDVPMSIVCGYKHYLCSLCSLSSSDGLSSSYSSEPPAGSPSIFENDREHSQQDFDVCKVLGIIPIL